MLLLYLSFACLLYFTCLYIVRKDENKDVQSMNQYYCVTPHTMISQGEVLLNGPLARYVKLRVAHAPGMPGTFSQRP